MEEASPRSGFLATHRARVVVSSERDLGLEGWCEVAGLGYEAGGAWMMLKLDRNRSS
jgi:hypothetical protein